ncbi:MAG: DUF2188 domain-containing protein [Thermoleophilaceae bacterium]
MAAPHNGTCHRRARLGQLGRGEPRGPVLHWPNPGMRSSLGRDPRGGRVKRIDVVKKGNEWLGESGNQTVRGTRAPTKAEAVQKTAQVARRDSEAVTVKIHKATGGIQEERTYPRSADPRRSKG